jgi:hypothetical protein
MNPKAHQIVQELETFSHTAMSFNLEDTSKNMAFLAFRTARLNVLLAEEQEKTAGILEHYTGQLVRLQWALIWLTVGLLVFTICLAIRH